MLHCEVMPNTQLSQLDPPVLTHLASLAAQLLALAFNCRINQSVVQRKIGHPQWRSCRVPRRRTSIGEETHVWSIYHCQPKTFVNQSIWKIFTCWGGVDDSKIFWLEISKMVLHWRIKKKTILISWLTLIILMIITIITISWPLTFSAVSTKTFLAKLRTASTFVSVISSTLSKKK